MKFDKDDTFAIIGTIIIHMILLFILYFAVIRTIVASEDSGILVNFGYVAIASGANEPQYSTTPPQVVVPPKPTPKPVIATEKELITQDKEESVAIPEKKETKKEAVADENAKRIQEEAERRRQEEAEKKRKEEEQRKQEEAISNLASTAFGKGSSPESNQGDTEKAAGNQGSPYGNANTGANEGTGGYGSFNLNGRSIGSGGLPRPAYNSQDEGKIVINITVDPNGNVILADIARGTNLTDASLRKSALDAAKRAKFNKIQGSNNANGTITYIYNLK